jgi:hypothetical protein
MGLHDDRYDPERARRADPGDDAYSRRKYTAKAFCAAFDHAFNRRR